MISLIFLLLQPMPVLSQNTYIRPELDFNGDCEVDLSDAMTGLKILTGAEAEIQGTKRIGIEEVIYILQKAAGIISEPEGYDEYEEDDHFEQARIIVINNDSETRSRPPQPQRHNFHDKGDEDWVMFYGIAGQTYTIEVKVEGLESNCDAVITLYDTDGKTPLKSENDGIEGIDESMLWKKCPADGIYYVKVSNFDPGVFGEDVIYELTVRNPESAFPGDVIGNVFDAYTGKKIPEVRIKTDAHRSAISNYCDCYFYCSKDYCIYWHPAGNYMLTAEAPGYEPFMIEIRVQELEITVQDIEMTPLN
jgi:hypothetical protein